MALPIGNVTQPGATTQTATATTGAISSDKDKDMFLKLLVAQMKYQDPSNPTDSTQYLSQMAQFTQVEKLGDLADSMSSMLASTQLTSAVSMVGATINYGAGDEAGTGKVTGVTVIHGVPQLLIGQTKVALADVTGVTG